MNSGPAHSLLAVCNEMVSPRSLVQKTRTYVFGKNRLHAQSLSNVGDAYIFVHIPKNAGSSVAKAMDMERSGHYTAQTYRQMLGRLAYYWRFSFAFVRNPWDRFLSLYHYARLEESQYHSAIDPESSLWGKHQDYDLLKNATIDDCAEYLVQGRLRHDDHITHWRPQVDWVTDKNGELIVDFVGHVETIDKSFRTVADRLNLNIRTLPVTNRSRDASARRAYREAFTASAREIVAEYYRQDIETFGYEY